MQKVSVILSTVLSLINKYGKIVPITAAALIILFGSVYSIMQQDRVKSEDEPAFYDLATNLATKYRFYHTNKPGYDFHYVSSPDWELRPTAYRAPGYVFFLAPFVKLGAGYAALRILNFILLAITLLLVYVILKREYSPLAGVIASIFIMCYPVLLYAASALYPQTLQTFLLIINLLLLTKTGPGKKPVIYGVIGITYGVLILTVPVNLLLFPFIIIWLFFIKKVRISHIALMVTAAAIIVCSWTVRNYVVFKTFIPVASSAGFNLLNGNCPNARANTSVNVRWPEYVYQEIEGKGEIEQSKIMSEAAVKYIKENPGATLLLYIQKFINHFHYKNQLMSDIAIEGGASDVPVNLRNIVMLFTYVPLMIIFIIRLFVLKRFSLTAVEILMIMIYIGAGLVYALFFTRIRFRLPFDVLIMMINAGFLAELIKRLSEKKLTNA